MSLFKNNIVIKINRRRIILINVIFITVVFVCLSLINFAYGNDDSYANENVPRLDLKLNGVTLEQINAGSKETKYEGNDLTITNSEAIDNYSNVEIKGRGNTTWSCPKKPYQIKLDKKVDLFGLGKLKKWVLLADWFDQSHLRNNVAFYVAQLLGMQYSWDGEYINLYVDGKYIGLY